MPLHYVYALPGAATDGCGRQGGKGESMTAERSTDERGRVHFGRLAVTPARTPQDRALTALGEAVPALEAALGFPVSVTAQARPDGFIFAEIIVPDAHYSLSNTRRIGQMLRDAVRPFELLYIEVDSDAPYAQ